MEAKEARKITNEVISEGVSSILEGIFEDIQKAAEDGKSKITRCRIHNKVKDTLVELGYHVDIQANLESTISW
jgi:hypothetical protein